MKRHRRRRSYRGLSRPTSTALWAVGGLTLGGLAVWIFKTFIEQPSVPPGSIVTATGQVITPAQQSSLLTPVSLVS